METTESETKVSYRKEPWEPYSPIGLTSEELAEDINWDDAKFYMSSPAGWREAVKMGLAILLVGLCLFGIMIVLDYMQGGV